MALLHIWAWGSPTDINTLLPTIPDRAAEITLFNLSPRAWTVSLPAPIHIIQRSTSSYATPNTNPIVPHSIHYLTVFHIGLLVACFCLRNPALASTTSQLIFSHHASRNCLFPSTPQSRSHTCSHVFTHSMGSSSTPPGAMIRAFRLIDPKLPAFPTAPARLCVVRPLAYSSGVICPCTPVVVVAISTGCAR